MIEPVKYIFDRLVKNYSGHDLSFENCAVFSQNTIRSFYRVDSQTDPQKYKISNYERLGSFFRETIESEKNRVLGKIQKNEKNYIIEEKVQCHTFEFLIDKYKISRIDLLQIDAQGYDCEIIKNIPFNKIVPKMIYYEDKIINRNDRAECVRLLKSKGYKLIKSKDMFAYLPN